MTLAANSNGVVTGKFTIPQNVPSGRKLVEFVGSGGSYGSAFFQGKGEVWIDQQKTYVTNTTYQTQTNVTQTYANVGIGYPWYYYGYCWHRYWWNYGTYWDWYWYWGYYGYGYYDPLAQTFMVDQPMQLGGVELFVRAKGTTMVRIQLRTVSGGVPTDRVLAVSEKMPQELAVGAWNRWLFAEPVQLSASEEYAICVLCDDADTEIAIAELGKWDDTHQRWITSQPYTIGVLLSSSNASTWTPHQDRDMAFRLVKATYAPGDRDRTVQLGTVALSGTTDLMLLAENKLPTAACRVSYSARMPDGSVIPLDPMKGVRLASPVTGNVTVSARLRGDENASPILAPGAQLVRGTVATSASYVTRAVPAGTNSRVVVIFDANVPSGAAVVPTYSGVDPGDTFKPFDAPTTKPIGDGWNEFTFVATSVNEASIRLKLALTGTAQARPMVANLRVVVT